MQIDRATIVPRLAVRLAQDESEVRAAQRLRWQVFGDEQGAHLASAVPGYDIDPLDQHCDHLIVTKAGSGEVVGTYRLLTAEGAMRNGGYYSEQEFDLGRLKKRRRRLLEIGRSCVHRDHRNGATIALLWSGIAAYLAQSRHDAIIGCASIPLNGRQAGGASLAHRIAADHIAAPALHVTPRVALPLGDACDEAPAAAVPPLIKGYLRSGGVVCGEPYWDRAFNSADLFMYLDIEKLELRYARHFLAPATAGV